MKISPNYHDRNEIKRMVALGMEAKEISSRLKIELGGITRHLETLGVKEPEAPPATTRRRKRAG